MARRPQWFRGYTVAAVATIAFLATAPGQTFIVSQLNAPLRETFDIPKLALNASYTIATIAAAIPLVIVGSLTDRLGPRRMLALTAFAFGLGCMFMSAVNGLLTVFIAFFLLRFLGQGSLSLVSQHALAMWFYRRLGSIHGLKQVLVFGLWSGFPAIAVMLINAVGWRWTYILFGLSIWVAVIPLSLWLVRDRPEDHGLHMDNDAPQPDQTTADGGDDETAAGNTTARDQQEAGFTLRQALRTRAYWTLAATFLLPPLIGTAFLFDIQPILMPRGLSEQQTAIVVSAWSAAMAIMAVPAGVLTDRLKPPALLVIGFTAIAASAAAMMFAQRTFTAAAAMILFAIGQSIIVMCAGATTARYFGRAHHGAIRSSLARIGVFGTGLGPICTGLSAQLTGEYRPAMLGFIGLCLPVIVLAFQLAPPGDHQRRT